MILIIPTLTTHLLAFTPLIDPLSSIFPNLDDYWLILVIPVVLAISLVYKGTRVATVRRLPVEAATMAAQILILMLVASVGLYALTYLWLRK
jgi:hypothetical protein